MERGERHQAERYERYPFGEKQLMSIFKEGKYRKEDLDLTRLENLADWRVAEGEPDIRGWHIVNNQSDTIGEVESLIVSPKTRLAYFLVARVGGMLGMGGKHVLVPLDFIHLDRDNQQVRLDSDQETLSNAVQWSADQDVDYLQAYRYWDSRIGEHREEPPVAAERRELAGVSGGEAPPASETTIPLREEELIARRSKHQDEIDVEKHVISEQRTVEVPVTRTEVEIERRTVSGAAREHVEGDITESEVRIPIAEEEMHIEKHPVVKEEIIVRQHPKTVTEQHTETIRREVAEVHKEGDLDVETKGDVEMK